MKEKLFVRAGEMPGEKLPQQLLMNVLLHRTSRAPAEAPAHQQPHPVARL